jgi:pyruvate,orthophosphate dikinase
MSLETSMPLDAAPSETRWVYNFGGGGADGDASMKNLLGGKGSNLAEMSALGLPVPPGFTITTEACTYYYGHGRTYPRELRIPGAPGSGASGALTGKRFGDPANPLLVSVRSGARASMPGMMDTVLNLGLNDQTVEGLARLSGDRRFASTVIAAFIQMYSNVVLDLDHHLFEEVLDEAKAGAGRPGRHRPHAEDWERVVATTRPWCAASSATTSPGRPGAALGRGRRRLRELDERPRQVLPAHARHPEAGARRSTSSPMVFGNMGETFGHGRGLHPQPFDRARRASTASS